MEEQAEHDIISQTLWSEHSAQSGDKSVSWSLTSETCIPSESIEKLEELSTISYSESNSSISNQLSEETGQKVGMYDLNQNPVKGAPSKSSSSKTAGSRKPSSSTVSSEEGSGSPIASGAACVVCGDKASGKHYGQITCEGCKSFFKRSVRRNMNYTCRGSRDCAIDPQHRNQCQYCRLRKCVKAGMRKEAVQRGRVTQNLPLEYSACHMPHLTAANGLMDPNQPRTLPPSYVNNMLSVLVRAEPFSNHSGSPPVSGASNSEMDTVCEVSRQVLYSALEWARRIPYFTDISPQDQDVLIRRSWAELFVLNFIQWCPTVYARSIIGAVTRYANEHNIDHEGISYLLHQIEKLYSLQIDRAECSALKSLVLFNPDCLSLTDVHSIGTLQDRALASLEEYDKVYYTNYPNRFGKLLMRLSTLKTINSTVIDQAFFASVDMKGSPVGVMLRDMYALSSSMCWPHTGDPGLAPSHATPQ